jgi:hypothetical protein
MLGTGMVLIGVPLSVGYSYSAMKAAPDRRPATIAFVLSLVSLAGLLWFFSRFYA